MVVLLTIFLFITMNKKVYNFIFNEVNNVRIWGDYEILRNDFSGKLVHFSDFYHIYNKEQLKWVPCFDMNYYLVKFLQSTDILDKKYYIDQKYRVDHDIFLEDNENHIEAYLLINKEKLYYIFQGVDFGGTPPFSFKGYKEGEDCSGLNNEKYQ